MIGPKGTVLIGQNRAIHWLELCSSDWMGKTSVLLVEIGLQGLHYRGWLRWQTHSVGRQFSAGFSLKCGLHEKPLCRNDYYALFFVCFYFIFLKILAQLATRSPSYRHLRVHTYHHYKM